MKKLFLLFALVGALSAHSQKAKDTIPAVQEKVYTIQLKEKELNLLFAAIDRCDLPHITIEGFKKYLIDQLNKQQKQTSK